MNSTICALKYRELLRSEANYSNVLHLPIPNGKPFVLSAHLTSNPLVLLLLILSTLSENHV